MEDYEPAIKHIDTLDYLFSNARNMSVELGSDLFVFNYDTLAVHGYSIDKRSLVLQTKEIKNLSIYLSKSDVIITDDFVIFASGTDSIAKVYFN